MVTYINRKTSSEVQADFPLHPTLVNVTTADGGSQQYLRPDFDAEFSQQVPPLPEIDDKVLETGPAPITIDQEERAQWDQLATAHNGWFVVIFRKLGQIEKRLDRILAILEDEDVTPVADPPPNTG